MTTLAHKKLCKQRLEVPWNGGPILSTPFLLRPFFVIIGLRLWISGVSGICGRSGTSKNIIFRLVPVLSVHATTETIRSRTSEHRGLESYFHSIECLPECRFSSSDNRMTSEAKSCLAIWFAFLMSSCAIISVFPSSGCAIISVISSFLCEMCPDIGVGTTEEVKQQQESIKHAAKDLNPKNGQAVQLPYIHEEQDFDAQETECKTIFAMS